MPRDLALPRLSAGLIEAVPQPWRAPLGRLGASWLALVVVFWREWAAMAAQWWNSSTYNHILLIPLILAWLVSLRWKELQKLAPEPWWPGLIPFGGAGFLWLLGSFAGLSQASQLGAVVMLQASALTLLGPRVAAGLAFPLCYMLFMVPFGDELVPALQILTAHLTMLLLFWTHLPATLEGVFITTPTGLFEVAEACSGVKFLIAMIAYGALVANVCFRSVPRRIAFMAVSVAMPIAANGVRAWGTIYIAYYRGIEFAASFDHIFYGWVFFAVVMALVMALGWRFFDRAVDDPMIDAGRIAASPVLGRAARLSIGGVRALALLASVLALTLMWSAIGASLRAALPAQVFLPDVPGWQRTDYKPKVWWEPRQAGSDHRLLGRYADGKGRVVDVSYALYASQEEGREAGGFGEGALTPETGWAWVSPGKPQAGAKADRIRAEGSVERLALTWYRTGDLLTGSNLRLKLANIGDTLLLRRRATAALIVSAEDRREVSADESVAAFLAATGPVDAWMDRLGEGR